MSDASLADADWFRFAGWEEGYLVSSSGHHHPEWRPDAGAGEFRARVGVPGMGERWVFASTDGGGCEISVGGASGAVVPLVSNPTRGWVRELCAVLRLPVCAEPCPDAADEAARPIRVGGPCQEIEDTPGSCLPDA